MKQILIITILLIAASSLPLGQTKNNKMSHNSKAQKEVKPAQRKPAAVSSKSTGLFGQRVSPRDSLEITSATRERIRGSLIRGSIGVIFDSWKQGTSISLELKTLQGKELVSLKERGTDIVASVGGGITAAMKKADLLELQRTQTGDNAARVTGRQEKLAKSKQESAVAVNAQLQAKARVQGDRTLIQSVRRAPEYALLPSLSWELGKLGFTGQRYPPSRAIHAVGAGAGQSLGVDPRKSGVVYRQKLPRFLEEARASWEDRVKEGDPCTPTPPSADPTTRPPTPNQDPRRTIPPPQVLDRNWKPWRDLMECRPPTPCKGFPNQDNDCFGMCGPGCGKVEIDAATGSRTRTCWDWICGDCCYHEFCAVHDAALRDCLSTAFPLSCINGLIPWYFIFTGCD